MINEDYWRLTSENALKEYRKTIEELKTTKRAIFFGDIRNIFINIRAIKALEREVESARRNYNHAETEYQFAIGNNPWSMFCPA